VGYLAECGIQPFRVQPSGCWERRKLKLEL
jgi:hypothetical protein